MAARNLALDVLVSIVKDGAYSNLALDEALRSTSLSSVDKRFATELVYGTLTHYRLLDFHVSPYFKGRVKPWLRILLLMTLYQMIHLDKIPDHAAVNEAVAIAKQRGGEFNGKLINGILRNIVKTPRKEPANIAIATSHPDWLINLWEAQYGPKQAKAMAVANNERAKTVIRTNLQKVTRDELQRLLKVADVDSEHGALSDGALVVKKGSVATLDLHAAGLFYIQDEASQLVAKALAPSRGASVLDVCAAPGGKTLHLAELVGEGGEVIAHDIHEHKIDLINENAARLGIGNVRASVQDATRLADIYEAGSFDYILIDAPCSGLGILKRHPEAKLFKKPEDLDAIVQIQAQILAAVAPLLASGGRLVYSTCTVNRKENDRQVMRFLAEHPDFKLDEGLPSRLPQDLANNFEAGMLQLFPQDFATDGFFIASLLKT